MKTKHIVAVIFLLCLPLVFGAITLAQPPDYELEHERSMWSDEHWRTLVVGVEAQMVTLMNHDVDIGGPPTKDDIPVLAAADWTMASTGGYSLYWYAINNRKVPLNDPIFRRALAYCMDKENAYATLYGPLLLPIYNWVPPAQAQWENTTATAEFPRFNLQMAIDTLIGGGYTPHLIDGGLGAIPDNIEYWDMPAWLGGGPVPFLEQGATDSTVTNLQLSQWLEGDLHSAGLTSITHTPLDFNYIVGTWLTPPYMSWDLTIGIGLVFGVDPVVEVMYHVDATPFANIWGLDDPLCNSLIDDYMSTLSEAVAVDKVWQLECRLNELMPMIPMITSNTYTCCANQYTDPETGEEPGVLGFVNMKGFGGSRNDWSRLYSRREELEGSPPLPIANWIMGTDAEIINPLVSDTTYEWNLMRMVYDGLFIRNPYTHKWMPWAATTLSTVENGMIQLWNGTHRTTGTTMPETDRPWVLDTPPAGSPGEVIGEYMEFTMRDDMDWHDGEPVTAYDVEFALDLMVNQENERYDSIVKYIHDVVVVDNYNFKVYFTGRYAWAATDVGGLGLLCPEHVWKPYIAGEDQILWTEDDRDHRFWDGSDWTDEYGYAAPTVDTPSGSVQLTHLIGSGYCVYPQGGWVQGQSMRLIRWDPGTSGWYYERIHRGDNNFDGITDMADEWPTVFASGTEAGMTNWVLYNAGPRADMANPSGLIDGRDREVLDDTWGYYWYPHQTLP